MTLPTIAFSTWAFPGEPVDRSIDHAFEHGFAALEIALLDPALFGQDGPLPTDAQARAVAARTADMRLSVHAPINEICLADPDPEVRAASAACLRQTIASSALMGARTIAFHLIRNSRDAALPLSEDAVGRSFARDLIGPLAEDAAAAGITLAVENIGISDRAADRDYTGLCDLVDGLALDNFGIALDVGHAHVHTTGLAEAAALFGSRICHYHVHDNDGTADQHLRVGAGNIDYACLLPQWQNGFPGILTMEIFPFVETDLDEAISASQTALTNLITPA